MKIILLMVLFSDPQTPAPHQEPGFAPRQVASMETCHNRQEFMNRYLSQILHPDTRFKVYCVVKTAWTPQHDQRLQAPHRHPI